MDKQTELIMSQLQSLIKNGKIIQAIKLIRTVKNISLKDAKNFVDDFKRQIEHAGDERDELREQGIEPQSYLSEERHSSVNHPKYNHDFGHSHQHSVEKDLPTAAYLHLQRGETLQAIKEIRSVKGLSLLQAKQLAERFYAQNPQYHIAEEQKKKSVFPLLIFIGFGIFILSKIFS